MEMMRRQEMRVFHTGVKTPRKQYKECFRNSTRVLKAQLRKEQAEAEQ